ncbi:mannose-1-phosphate guanylyltransferase [Pleomorphovibrio marinus]|uniref:mannose-1-phosphate guanylyltransferase n=1 Tax=Pleomorphovibrio marinus TaxID=2164132 RepID=UPI000E0C0364|nr:mannose-1-phosphate guanylyltransferase [Pleomorphovibrio marinus]
MSIINVVLSGGVGSRLWPLSRKSKPKQYLPIFGNSSLFELTIDRNLSFCEGIMVVGSIDNFKLSREKLANLGHSYKEIIEATPRNTAAAIAFAAFSVEGDDILLVTPSDHLISKEAAYRNAVQDAINLAKDGFLVTFGLRPHKPETGFGYIEYNGIDVVSFREKPSLAKAEEYLSSGNFLWNSGMFCFSAKAFLSELKLHSPEVYEASRKAFEAMENGFLPLGESKAIPSISVDYAVMEKSKKIKVVPSEFVWSDMGSFEALYDHLGPEDHRRMGTNLVLGSEKHVEFLGVENIVLVDTKDAILVLNKNDAQEVKKIYERLERENPDLLN